MEQNLSGMFPASLYNLQKKIKAPNKKKHLKAKRGPTQYYHGVPNKVTVKCIHHSECMLVNVYIIF